MHSWGPWCKKSAPHPIIQQQETFFEDASEKHDGQLAIGSGIFFGVEKANTDSHLGKKREKRVKKSSGEFWGPTADPISSSTRSRFLGPVCAYREVGGAAATRRHW